MDQDEIWREVGLGPGYTVLDEDLAPTSPPLKRAQQPPVFGACLLWTNGWIDQDATWYGGKPPPRPHCVRWGPSSPEKGTAALTFRPMSIVAKRLHG